MLKCCQIGKPLSAEVKDLSREDGLPLTSDRDFQPGVQLLVEHKGKVYPVEFISYGTLTASSINIHILLLGIQLRVQFGKNTTYYVLALSTLSRMHIIVVSIQT